MGEEDRHVCSVLHQYVVQQVVVVWWLMTGCAGMFREKGKCTQVNKTGFTLFAVLLAVVVLLDKSISEMGKREDTRMGKREDTRICFHRSFFTNPPPCPLAKWIFLFTLGVFCGYCGILVLSSKLCVCVYLGWGGGGRAHTETWRDFPCYACIKKKKSEDTFYM